MEYTFAMIKPDATERNLVGGIISYIEKAGLEVVALKRARLTQEQAMKFYEVHKDRPFFSSLINTITSGPVVLMVLKGEGAISNYRKIMGATNPENAEVGTIRRDFAKNIEENSVHGSDSAENAALEIGYFFSGTEIIG